MIELQPHADGVILRVRALPGARKNAVLGEYNGALKVAVNAAPEKGKANKAVMDVLAKSLDLNRGQIELLTGETSQDKRFLVRGMTVENLREVVLSVVSG
jgi:uncharacterized protein (TIGR00251 family)